MPNQTLGGFALATTLAAASIPIFQPVGSPTGNLVAPIALFDARYLPVGATAAQIGYTYPGNVVFPAVGAVARTVQSRLSDTVSIRDFGAVGDGVTDDTTAAQNAFSSVWRAYLPLGIYNTTLFAPGLPFTYGEGQLRDHDGNLRARNFTLISASNGSYPTTFGDWSSVLTAFNGDLQFCQFPIEHRVLDTANVLPAGVTTGFYERPEFSPIPGYLYNTSGWNESTSSNVGRTAVAFMNLKIDHYGQGGAGGIAISTFVNSTRAGSTDVLANPAGYLIHGGATAGQAGVYLDCIEINATDNGYDVAAAGLVINLSRTVTTGAKNAFWYGARVQSGAAGAIDTAYSLSGKARFGLDLTGGTFDSNKSSVTLKADDRIYWNATAGNLFPSAVGTTSFYYSSSLGALHAVVANVSALQIYSNMVLSSLAIRSEVEYRVSTLKVLGARNTGWTAWTGNADKVAHATYPATVASGAYVQAELQGVMDKLTQVTEAYKALSDAGIGHGFIGT